MSQNTSATGGYTLPTSTVGPPRDLTLTQFLQTIFVGLTGLDGTMVRPKWQPAPPKQPDIDVSWMAFGIADDNPDANGYLGILPDGSAQYQRQTQLDISCSIYGPQALEIAGLIRDGFQIPQNIQSLTLANMGFVETGRASHIPDLVNERWINRVEMNVTLRRQVQRSYAVLTFLSAHGTVYTQTDGIGNQITVPIAVSDS